MGLPKWEHMKQPAFGSSCSMSWPKVRKADVKIYIHEEIAKNLHSPIEQGFLT